MSLVMILRIVGQKGSENARSRCSLQEKEIEETKDARKFY